MEKECFKSWFDSPYYHILYRHRDDSEAEFFIDQLYHLFGIKKKHTILDLACGAGRHSLYMAKKGNQVIGVDLSPNSISKASNKATESNLDKSVQFSVEDMRNFNLHQKFDFIFNLFTSFGYFVSIQDNQRVIQSISYHQEKESIVVIDYFNSELVRANGNLTEMKLIEGIEFRTEKKIHSNFVTKDISIKDQNDEFHFQEKVQLFHPNEIENLLMLQGYKIIGHYGNYNLDSYSPSTNRSIIIGKKS